MKTTRFQPVMAEGGESWLGLDTRCIVRANDTEKEFSLFGTLYAVLTLVRTRTPVRVIGPNGALLLDHTGETVLTGELKFQQYILDFEQFLIAEQRNGYDRAFAEVARRAAERMGN